MADTHQKPTTVKEKSKHLLKKRFRWIFLIGMFFLASLLVTLSYVSSMLLPIVCIIMTVLHHFYPLNRKLTFWWNAVCTSVGVYFTTFLFLFLYTPEWVKKLSLFIERYSLFKIYATGSYMYGRLFLSFVLSAIVFCAYYALYRNKRRV